MTDGSGARQLEAGSWELPAEHGTTNPITGSYPRSPTGLALGNQVSLRAQHLQAGLPTWVGKSPGPASSGNLRSRRNFPELLLI